MKRVTFFCLSFLLLALIIHADTPTTDELVSVQKLIGRLQDETNPLGGNEVECLANYGQSAVPEIEKAYPESSLVVRGRLDDALLLMEPATSGPALQKHMKGWIEEMVRLYPVFAKAQATKNWEALTNAKTRLWACEMAEGSIGDFFCRNPEAGDLGFFAEIAILFAKADTSLEVKPPQNSAEDSTRCVREPSFWRAFSSLILHEKDAEKLRACAERINQAFSGIEKRPAETAFARAVVAAYRNIDSILMVKRAKVEKMP